MIINVIKLIYLKLVFRKKKMLNKIFKTLQMMKFKIQKISLILQHILQDHIQNRQKNSIHQKLMIIIQMNQMIKI